jgi:predicted GNAT family acetyltransferase
MEKEFNFLVNDNIVATCIVVQENTNIYEINNVFVKEEARGNGYAKKLLEKVIDKYRTNKEINKNIMLKICTEITNIPAFKTYQKIFGDAYRYDSRYAYFSICFQG